MLTASPQLIKMLTKQRTDMSMTCHVSNHVMSLPGHVIVMCRADENSRVVLQYQRAQEGSDYINASFIDVSICVDSGVFTLTLSLPTYRVITIVMPS